MSADDDDEALFAAYKAKLEVSQQRCPVCQSKVLEYARFPSYLCHDCVIRVTDTEGDPVVFSNGDLGGEIMVTVAGSQTERIVTPSETFLIGSDQCRVQEGIGGGIVVSLIQPR